MDVIASLKHLNRQRNIKTKKLKTKAKLSFLKMRYRKRTFLQPGNYKSICIFMHIQAIGDGIVTSEFIKRLQDQGIKIYVIALEKVSFLFLDIIGVDGFFPYEKKKFKELKKELKNLNVDLVVDFSNFDSAAVFRLNTLFSLKPKHAICFNHPDITIFDTNVVETRSVHFSERMKTVLSMLNVKDDNDTVCLNFDNGKYSKADKVAAEFKKEGKKLIIFNPFGSQENRTLSNKQITEVLTYLNTLDGYHTIVFNMGRDINCSHFKNVSLTPFAEAGNAFALVRYADFVVTVDTAIVHLASALKVKQYCIYNNRMYEGRFENNIVWGHVFNELIPHQT